MTSHKKLNLIRVRVSRAIQPFRLEDHRIAVRAGEFETARVHVLKTIELDDWTWYEFAKNLTEPQKWLKGRGGVVEGRQGIYRQMVAVHRVAEGRALLTIYIDGNKTGVPVTVAFPLEDQLEIEVEPPQAPQKKTDISQLLELIEDESTVTDW